MVRRVSVWSGLGAAVILGVVSSALVVAQEPGARGRGNAPRPTAATMVMKVTFQPAVAGKTEQLPFVQANVADPNIELRQYGAAKEVLTNAGNDAQFIPFSFWTGEASGPFAITFRNKNTAFDLSGGAKIRWATKSSGFHQVRPVIKLTDGSMFVGDFTSEHVALMLTDVVPLATVRWVKLDPMKVVTLGSPGPANQIWVTPDLTKVDEVGVADLIPGSGHGTGGWIHVGSIEVYGKPVPRGTATAAR
jgi:hypothetical protein